LKSRNICNRTREIMKHEVRRAERIVWDIEISRVDRWCTIDKVVNFVDHLGVSWGKVPKPLHQDLTKLQSLKSQWNEGFVERSTSFRSRGEVHRSFGKSGFGSRGDELLDITTPEIAIRKNPK
jgi:hypothetical protein